MSGENLIEKAAHLLLCHPEATDFCLRGGGTGWLLHLSGEWRCVPWDWKSSDLPPLAQILRALSLCGLSWDAKNPFLDWIHSQEIRCHLALPPVAGDTFELSLRKSRPQNSQSTIPRWDEEAFSLLRAVWQEGHSLLIAGTTGSGKTTLLRDLLEECQSHERVLLIEDTSEIRPRLPHLVSLQTRAANADGLGLISARECVKQALRMRPNRIILGEVRGDEVLDLLTAASTGHRGLACTIHAHSTRDAFTRIELLTQLAGAGSASEITLRKWIANSFEWIVHLKNQKISAISQQAGIDAGTFLIRNRWSARTHAEKTA